MTAPLFFKLFYDMLQYNNEEKKICDSQADKVI